MLAGALTEPRGLSKVFIRNEEMLIGVKFFAIS